MGRAGDNHPRIIRRHGLYAKTKGCGITATPPSQPLADSAIHVWRASLSVSPEELAEFASLLSADEAARAGRFHFERDRARYVAGRGLLRTLLGGYLGTEASKIEFTYGPQGKPAIVTKVVGKSLQFNLSHSNEYAVYVFGWDRAVGIDIEHVRPMEDADDFASRFFSARESILIQSLTGHQKWDAFFKLWTCKEAFLKANGSGLTFPLNQAEVHLGMGGSAKLTSVGGDAMQASRWRLETFRPFLDYQASLAVEGQNWDLTFHQIDD